MKLKKIIAGLIIVSVMVTLAGCGQKQEVSPKGAGSGAEQGKPVELQKVVIAQPGIGENWLPVYLAKELGYFKDEGLDVSFTSFKGGPLVIAALLAGDAQFALTGYDQVLKTYDQGKSTKMIIASTLVHPWSLIVPKNITTFAQLKGQKVAAGMAGSSPRAFVRAAVKSGGLDPDKDLQYIDLPSPSLIGAMEKGEIDASFGYGLMKIQLMKKGFHTLVDFSVPEQHLKALGSKYYPLYVVQAADKYIKENPENVQKFTNAVVRANNWQIGKSSAEIYPVIAPLFSNTPKADLIEVINMTKTTLSPDGYFIKEGHDAVNRLSMDVGMVKKPVPMESVVDESFLKNAHEKYAK